MADMQDLQTVSIETLRKLIKVGRVVIVTNAKMEWVRFSMISFFPEMFTFLSEENIPIISAQDIFGSMYTNPVMWKVQSFRQLLLSYEVLPKKILSIGDGMHEKIACRLMCDEFSVSGIHVECQLEPTPKEMITQLTEICLHLDRFVELVSPNSPFMTISSNCLDNPNYKQPQETDDEMMVA